MPLKLTAPAPALAPCLALCAALCTSVALAGCVVTDAVGGVVDRMSEPFLSLLTGEELADVSTDPQYARDPVPEIEIFEPFVTGYGDPLAVVRFDSPPATYVQILGMAIDRALDARPEARFEVLAVSPLGRPGRGGMDRSARALNNAAAIMQALVDHGVSPDAIDMNAIANEAVESNGEVHIYIR